MDITINQKFIHTSPRKLRPVADLVRRMSPGRALEVLRLTQKAAASDLSDAIRAALASAKQQSLDQGKVNFKTIEVNEGPRLKRYRPGTRGRAKPYQRRMSHIKIVLSDEIKVQNTLEPKGAK